VVQIDGQAYLTLVAAIVRIGASTCRLGGCNHAAYGLREPPKSLKRFGRQVDAGQ
jgi:hypothetical protein